MCLKFEMRDECRSYRELVSEVSRWLENARVELHRARMNIVAPNARRDMRMDENIRAKPLKTYLNLCSELTFVLHCRTEAVKVLWDDGREKDDCVGRIRVRDVRLMLLPLRLEGLIP